jgi:phosphatidylglycerol:prolipoprotein diacylglycerol transferase
MFPVLFKIGPITIHTYGLFVALGFFLGIAWAVRTAPRFGLNPRTIQDLAFFIVIAALIGSRLWFVAIAWDYFREHPVDALKLWQGGLVFYGGLIAAILVSIAYMWIKKMPMFVVGDVLAPGLALGQAVGRIGCLAAGCCYGSVTDLPWAVTFTNGQCLAPLHQALHPTQLYASLGLMAIFAVLLFLQRRPHPPGQIFWTYGLLHGLFRPILETFRGDFRGSALIGPFTSTQAASLSFAAVSLFMLVAIFLLHHRASVRHV